MSQDCRAAEFHPSLFKTLTSSAAGALCFCLLNGAPELALAQSSGNVDPTQSLSWAPGAINHARQMLIFKDKQKSSQPTPAVVPQLSLDQDPSGFVATYQPSGVTRTSGNAFFQNMGTNGRTCFTCHQPQNGWTISAAGAQARFDASAGTEPLFRLVDGATCPSDDVSTLNAQR